MTIAGNKRIIKAAKGNTLSCKGWVQEAALRMLWFMVEQEKRPETGKVLI